MNNSVLVAFSEAAFIIENLLLVFSGAIYFNKRGKIKRLIERSNDLESALELKITRLVELQTRYTNDSEDLIELGKKATKEKEEANKMLTELNNQVEERRIVLQRQMDKLDKEIAASK